MHRKRRLFIHYIITHLRIWEMNCKDCALYSSITMLPKHAKKQHTKTPQPRIGPLQAEEFKYRNYPPYTKLFDKFNDWFGIQKSQHARIRRNTQPLRNKHQPPLRLTRWLVYWSLPRATTVLICKTRLALLFPENVKLAAAMFVLSTSQIITSTVNQRMGETSPMTLTWKVHVSIQQSCCGLYVALVRTTDVAVVLSV